MAIARSQRAVGSTPWKEFTGPQVAIEAPAPYVAKPLFMVRGLGSGSACFDDVTITEHGPDGSRVVATVDPGTTATDWYLWSANGSGETYALPAGVRGGKALCARGTNSDANMSNWTTRFVPVPGRLYSVEG